MANRLFGKIGINYKIKRINLVFDGNGDKKVDDLSDGYIDELVESKIDNDITETIDDFDLAEVMVEARNYILDSLESIDKESFSMLVFTKYKILDVSVEYILN